MTDFKQSRSVMKTALTNAYGDLGVLIAEDDYEAVVLERERIKALYLEFRDVHTSYHATLKDDADIDASDAFLCDVQKQYIKELNTAKTALVRMRPNVQMTPQLNNDQCFQTLGQLINLPPLQIQKFSGEPEEFDNFIATFNEVIGKVISDPAAKLLRLKSQLTGIALESIKMCRTDSGEAGYTRAMKILHDRFGSPYIVCNSMIERLKHGPEVRTPEELRTFSDELANAEVTLTKNKMFSEIDTQNNIVQICLRLEASLRYKWRNRIVKHKQSTGVYLNFADFVVFVQQRADIVNDPLYGRDVLLDRGSQNIGKKSVSSLAVCEQEPRSSISCPDSHVLLDDESLSCNVCHLCSKGHKLYTCYKFRGMPLDKRSHYVKTNNLCTLCLDKNHSVSQCKSNYKCRVNNCGERHSSALHVYGSQSTTAAAYTQSCNNSTVHMPTVPVVIDGIYQTFALLDSGSSTTFCSRRLVDELQLQGSDATFDLQTLHGTDNHCTKVVSLRMSSPDGARGMDLSNVLVVDEIPVESSSLSDISKYPHLKDLTFLEATQVDILIGQDNSAALIPLEIRRGHVNAPFATLTMMGWSLNGCAHASAPSHSATSYIISATILNEKINQLCEPEETVIPGGTLDEFKVDQEDAASDEHSLPHTTMTKPLCDMQHNVYRDLDLIILLNFVWFFLMCIISQAYVLSLFSYSTGRLEASYASTGGVLPLVDHVNQSVTNFTYLLIMARLLAAMINDYEEYILCYVKTFVYSLLIYHFILRSLFSFTYDCEYTI